MPPAAAPAPAANGTPEPAAERVGEWASDLAPDPAVGLRVVRRALADARAEAALACAHSTRLCDRAAGAAHVAVAVRDLAERSRTLWQPWHRIWAVLAAADGPRLMRVCAYCGEADLAHADPAGTLGWTPVPSWLRERLDAGTLGVRMSHGACPTCAAAYLGSAERSAPPDA